MVACHLTRIRLEMVTPKYKEKDLLEVKTDMRGFYFHLYLLWEDPKLNHL